MDIRSAADLEPHSTGFINRGAETITILGGVVETLLNGLGGALSDITGQRHGSHLDINTEPELDLINPPPTLKDQLRIQAVNRTVVDRFAGVQDLQDYIDKQSMR